MPKNKTLSESANKEINEKLFCSISEDAQGSLMVKDDFEKDIEIDQKSNEIKARETAYTRLTENFQDNFAKTHKQKLKLKSCFFWITMSLYICVVLGSMSAILASLFIEGSQTEIVLSAVAAIITSIIAIPTIIAKYLFPINEDKDLTSLITNMQKYDNGIRNGQLPQDENLKDSKLDKDK